VDMDAKTKTIIEYVAIAAGAIVLALLIQAFVVKPYRIPSGSMENTLLIGDRVLVNRVVYHTRDPRRGDIVVFNDKAVGKTLIKRIIALPGETISLRDGRVYINGQVLNEPYVRPKADGSPEQTVAFTSGEPWSLEHPYTLGPNDYFMMGDNRTDSGDSRDWGPMHRSEIIGAAIFRYWPPMRVRVL
jgi:signal peptidase I